MLFFPFLHLGISLSWSWNPVRAIVTSPRSFRPRGTIQLTVSERILRRGYVSRDVRWTYGRERILRAKLKHNIPGSTRNSISRWATVELVLVHRPAPTRPPTTSHGSIPPHPLLAAAVWQVFNITWKFWAVLRRAAAILCCLSVTNVPRPCTPGHGSGGKNERCG